ncbi:4-carboxymuconolactone decarboxylase [Paraburkholderia unamae]|uniref:carboxymuconolactone decarboxylase family protein n=1 Tax=Paraburkholderia unamae TaxID=219649 RepID=UPI001CAC81C1|nr:carboxymuconolactone decarboxylase family protein [Paraburkholderia unamae]CAG9272926.1 4-carboxymuconolactone decarboxylase [Paraburkholderia unamae]
MAEQIGSTNGVSFEDVAAVAPALGTYTRTHIVGDLWKRPGLSVRDRSLVTISALIARSQTVGYPHYIDLALENGVTPRELSEVVTHLAFYAGWPNALSVIAVVRECFSRRGVDASAVPLANPDLLPLDEVGESKRAERVSELFGDLFPGVVQYTTDALFRDLWLRPGLLPRDRSLVTVSALIALGHVTQLPYHLNRAMDAGLTQAESAEVVTQLAFYSGWPSAFAAMPVIKEILEKRVKLG